MAGQRNGCKMCLLLLIFVTGAIMANDSKPILRMGPSASSMENFNPDGKPILREGPSVSDSVSSSSNVEEEVNKPVVREGGDSDSDSTSDEVPSDNGPRMTRGVLRDQADNGEVSSERRKRRNANFYSSQPVREEK